MRRDYPPGFEVERVELHDSIRFLRVFNNTNRVVYCFRYYIVQRVLPGERKILDFGNLRYLESLPCGCDPGLETATMVMRSSRKAAGNFMKEAEL